MKKKSCGSYRSNPHPNRGGRFLRKSLQTYYSTARKSLTEWLGRPHEGHTGFTRSMLHFGFPFGVWSKYTFNRKVWTIQSLLVHGIVWSDVNVRAAIYLRRGPTLINFSQSRSKTLRKMIALSTIPIKEVTVRRKAILCWCRFIQCSDFSPSIVGMFIMNHDHSVAMFS
jgi:hypothetical protein